MTMDISITPRPLSGKISAIASKSAAHRLLICAALTKGETEIRCQALSEDIIATAQCLRAMGAGISYENGSFKLKPIAEKKGERLCLDCGESGSTLRFLLPVLCALGLEADVKMHGRLPQRPMSPLWEELEAHGAVLSRPEADVIRTAGRLESGEYKIRADVSSQFISGLLFALPLLPGNSSLELLGNVESAAYIDMTRSALKQFGVEPELDGKTFRFSSGAAYSSPGLVQVEGDWSNAAFWLAAEALSGEKIIIDGLDEESLQGDRAVIAAIEEIKKGGAVIDAKDIPDLVPVLSVLAALSPGETEFINAGRLRIKESDRLKAVKDMLEALGGECRENDTGLSIKGRPRLRGGVVDSAGDHRIAMSAAVAAIGCEAEVTVLGAEAVRKSYPGFFEDYKKLGGDVR